ncbi:MAG: hypothetical protein WED34_14170 [Planctomycetales bacterium]
MKLALAYAVILHFGAGVVQADGKPSSPPRAVAIKFVSALFIDHDLEAALKLVDKNAAIGTSEPGSLQRSLRELPVDQFKDATLNEIVFFSKANIPRVKERYPAAKWDALEEKIGGALGCLTVLDTGEVNEPFLALIVVQEVDGQHMVVFSDDN